MVVLINQRINDGKNWLNYFSVCHRPILLSTARDYLDRLFQFLGLVVVVLV